MTRLQMSQALADRPVDALWAVMLAHARTLQPFWEGAVRVFATRTGLPEQKTKDYLGLIVGAFDKMDDWRHGRAKYVKARRQEIDTVISFLRNKAIENANNRLRIAPVARNAAGALRITLTVSAHGYLDSDLAEIVANVLVDMAAVRTSFPYDLGHLMSFSPGPEVPPEVDRFMLTLDRAGEALGIQREVKALRQEADRIWEELYSPAPLRLSADYWTAVGSGGDAQLRQAAIVEFHRPG